MRKSFKIATTALIVLAFSLGASVPAQAASEFSGGVKDCSQYANGTVQVQSTSTGRINHSEGVTVLGSWNNGSVSTTRYSPTGKASVPSWRTYLSGVGGNVTYGNAICRIN